MMNRGFELLGRVGGDIDMLLAESVMADWQGPGHKPRLVASDEVAELAQTDRRGATTARPARRLFVGLLGS